MHRGKILTAEGVERQSGRCAPAITQMSMRTHTRILVVAPFTHQNGHFVTFPRDISCALRDIGYEVTLLHARPFRTELDWRGNGIERICLRDHLESAPRWWKEIWMRLANSPSSQCLAWIIWQVRPQKYDLILWTDFQAQPNVWPLRIASFLRLYRFKTAIVEHHPPDEQGKLSALLPRALGTDRIRLSGLTMVVFSKYLLDQWEARLGTGNNLACVPWGVWPQPVSETRRTLARQTFGIDDQVRVLLVFGVQAVRRKHIDTLLEVAASFPPRSSWCCYSSVPPWTNPTRSQVGAATASKPGSRMASFRKTKSKNISLRPMRCGQIIGTFPVHRAFCCRRWVSGDCPSVQAKVKSAFSAENIISG